MLHLVPMTEAGFQAFLERTVPTYADEKTRAGFFSPEEALEKSRAEYDKYLPQGVATPDQYLYTLFDDELACQVGVIWLGTSAWGQRRRGFIYDLYVDEPYRRRGYGRQAMLLIEARARELGLAALDLNVWGFNHAARALYQQVGYEETAITMTRWLK